MKSNLKDMNDADYDAWIRQVSGATGSDVDSLGDEALIALFSNALKADSVRLKADLLVELANKCVAAADKILGCQNLVTTTFVITH